MASGNDAKTATRLGHTTYSDTSAPAVGSDLAKSRGAMAISALVSSRMAASLSRVPIASQLKLFFAAEKGTRLEWH